jgi:hypothetical protein
MLSPELLAAKIKRNQRQSAATLEFDEKNSYKFQNNV